MPARTHTPRALQAHPEGCPQQAQTRAPCTGLLPIHAPRGCLCAALNRTQGSPSSGHEAAGGGRRRGCAAEEGSLCPQHPLELGQAACRGLLPTPHPLEAGRGTGHWPPMAHPLCRASTPRAGSASKEQAFLDPEPSQATDRSERQRGLGRLSPSLLPFLFVPCVLGLLADFLFNP